MSTIKFLKPRHLFFTGKGGVIGGGILVGAMYWFIYLRKREPSKTL